MSHLRLIADVDVSEETSVETYEREEREAEARRDRRQEQACVVRLYPTTGRNVIAFPQRNPFNNNGGAGLHPDAA